MMMNSSRNNTNDSSSGGGGCNRGTTAAEDEINNSVSTEDENDDDEGEEEEEEEPISINLDQNGRVVFGGKLNYNFQCYENIFDLPMGSLSYSSIGNDCNIAFTAREMQDDDDYSSGDTFFLPAGEEPSTKLERLVKNIFDHHTKGIQYNPALSGAEWWTLVVDPDDGGVGFHWDKDYGMEDHGVSI